MKATKEQIDLWRKQYGDIFEYKATTDVEGNSIYDEKGNVKEGQKELRGYLYSPSLLVLDACKMTSGKSELKFNEALVANCWIDGDKELIEVDEYKAGLFQWLGVLIKIVSGELKKL